MALDNLRKNFTGPAAALGMSVAAAMSPLGAAFANDSAPDANATTISASSSSTASLTPEQIERLEVDQSAFHFARDNYGAIGITVLGGAELAEIGETAQSFAAKFEKGLPNKYGIQAAAFVGDNGNGATAITYHYQILDTDNDPIVRSIGPMNIGDAVEKLPEVIQHVRDIKEVSPVFAYGMN